MKAKDAEFKDQFRDKKVQNSLMTKNGEKGDDKIDASAALRLRQMQ